jgi:amidase
MARDVAGTAAGMALLEPGFVVDAGPASRLGRIRPTGILVDPRIDQAVDAALARSGLAVTETDLAGWRDALRASEPIICSEAAAVNRPLLARPQARAKLGAAILARLQKGEAVAAGQLQEARTSRQSWRAAVTGVLGAVDLLVLPTVPFFPPLLADAEGPIYNAYTIPVSMTGCPALSLPVPSVHHLPASLQLIGPPGSEALLLATGAVIEAAADYRPSM